MLERLVAAIERLIFGHRAAVLGVLALVTLIAAVFAARLHMSAGFGKQLPLGHEYTETFVKYKDVLFGANRLIVVVHARQGDIWKPESLKKLNEVTQALLYLPGVDRRSVSSLWTPNTRVMQVTEEGYEARDVIGGDITPEKLDAATVAKIRDNVVQGGYMGSLVASDGSGAMVTADLLDADPRTKAPTDYIALGPKIEAELRAKFEDAGHEIRIIGFAKQISDIAEGANGVIQFFVLAFVLTALAVWWYCRSWAFTAAALVCSLVSLVWQFASLQLLGYGLDPLAILVPFLVFAIGVSHGVQQINTIVREIGAGTSPLDAARHSFGALLVPGTMALVTAFVGFATLLLIPIPMIRELAITASLGVAYKIVTNLIMLPVVASYVKLDAGYAQRMHQIRERRSLAVVALARLAEPGTARVVVAVSAVLFGLAVWGSLGRHIGYVQPGAPELRDSARYNRDAVAIAEKFSVGLDVLTVVHETAPDSCYDRTKMAYIDELAWELANTEGVIGTASLPALVKLGAAGFNEGNPRWGDMPRDKRSMASFIGLVGEGSGLYDPRCTVLPINVYLTDHKAETIKRSIDVVKAWRSEHQLDG
ncbi:MAG: RND family transporter, partial [Rubrivivax sp.]|nr:RND family transporter [Rubrivivax sp.]